LLPQPHTVPSFFTAKLCEEPDAISGYATSSDADAAFIPARLSDSMDIMRVHPNTFFQPRFIVIPLLVLFFRKG
jgi:hypothetical protein